VPAKPVPAKVDKAATALEIIEAISWRSTEDKRRWKIVRTDDYSDVPGEIILEPSNL
jgi:hypothetical protein